MEIIPSTVIIFVSVFLLLLGSQRFSSSLSNFYLRILGFSQFPYQCADRLPEDDGRLEVAECLGKSLSWVKDEFIKTEDHLYQLCEATNIEKTHIQDILKIKHLNPDEVFHQVHACLGNHAEELITRYKKCLPDAIRDRVGNPEFPKINELVVGLCETGELVEFETLDDEEKSKSLKCLKNCAVTLFGKFDSLRKMLQRNNDKMTRKEESDQLEPSTRKTIENYIGECENETDISASMLNEIGSKYARAYIDDINGFYNTYPTGETKDKFVASIISYFACAKWTCTMKTREGVPFYDLLENTIDRISENDKKLLQDSFET